MPMSIPGGPARSKSRDAGLDMGPGAPASLVISGANSHLFAEQPGALAMAIRAKRLPEHGVTVVIWSGRVTAEEIRRHIDTLDAAYSYTNRWLQYWDPSVDASGLDIAAIPELKRLLTAKAKELYGDKRAISALVRAPGADLLPEFWPGYASSDHAYPAEVAVFPSLEAACAWLNLSDVGCRAAIDAIEGSSHPSHESRSPGSSAGAKL